MVTVTIAVAVVAIPVSSTTPVVHAATAVRSTVAVTVSSVKATRAGWRVSGGEPVSVTTVAAIAARTTKVAITTRTSKVTITTSEASSAATKATTEATTAAATFEASAAALEASSATTEATAKTARAAWASRQSFRIAPATEAASKSPWLPALDCSATLNIYLDPSIFDADTITSIQSGSHVFFALKDDKRVASVWLLLLISFFGGVRVDNNASALDRSETTEFTFQISLVSFVA